LIGNTVFEPIFQFLKAYESINERVHRLHGSLCCEGRVHVISWGQLRLSLCADAGNEVPSAAVPLGISVSAPGSERRFFIFEVQTDMARAHEPDEPHPSGEPDNSMSLW
jgi:hypothetical protein